MRAHVDVAAIVIVCSLHAACATTATTTRAALATPPPVDAPIAARATAYEALRPAPSQMVHVDDDGVAFERSLQLADGTVVVDARDLVPAVRPDSPTALHAARATSSQEQAWWWNVAAGGVGVVGLGVTAGYASTLQLETIGDAEFATLAALGGATVGAACVLLVVGGFAQSDATFETEAAFRSYDRDLRARLDLVPNGDELAKQWRASR